MSCVLIGVADWLASYFHILLIIHNIHDTGIFGHVSFIIYGNYSDIASLSDDTMTDR